MAKSQTKHSEKNKRSTERVVSSVSETPELPVEKIEEVKEKNFEKLMVGIATAGVFKVCFSYYDEGSLHTRTVLPGKTEYVPDTPEVRKHIQLYINRNLIKLQ